MLKFSLLACAVLSTAAVAQSPLTTTFANNNGGAIGGAVYFDLTVNAPINLNSVDLNLTGAAGTIEVWTLAGSSRSGNQTNQVAWTMAATGTVTAAGAGLPSPVTLSNPVTLPVGLVGMTFVAQTGVAHSYTNGTGANQTFSTAELTLNAGEASNVAFTAPLFTPRVVNCNLHYTLAGAGVVAQRVPYGIGGGASQASIYENFATAASFDLNGLNIQFDELPGGGWSISQGTGFVAAVAAVPFALTDDSEVTQALSSGFAASVNVCSNGFLSVGGSNGTAFTPDVNAFLLAGFESWRIWHDCNPAAGGQVTYEFVGGEDVVTYDNVVSFGTTVGNTFQFRMSVVGAQRRMVVSIVQMSGVGGGILVGYSPAGASVDPGNRDISAATFPVNLGTTDVPGVALNASARPVLGTSITVSTTNIPGSAIATVIWISAGQILAGFDLSVFGAPGNFLYLASIDSTVNAPSFVANIPNFLGLNGATFYMQSAVINIPSNPLGLLTTNGLQLTLGNL